jgi:hypothetical protein
MPVPLDEFPIHQTPLSLRQVGTSDRNFYDRWYFNAHDRTGDIFLVAGAGFYPNLGVKDAYVCLRRGEVQRVLRCSDEIGAVDAEARLTPSIGPFAIEVEDPLQRLHVTCAAADHGVDVDLTWQGSFAAVDEARHLLLSGARPIVDTWRFAQVGSWSGTIRIDDDVLTVDPDVWVGTRDRSWGIRPIGDPEPAGRPDPAAAAFGFWWLYVPIRFDDFAIVLIAQEDGDGSRSLNDAVRVWPDGRIEQLGWPVVRIRYRPGTRHPESAVIDLQEPDGTALRLEVDTLASVPLHVGCGYGGDPEWLHGQWRGAGWVETASYDMTDPAILARVPFGVIDHIARARVGGRTGWGLFEHGSIGRHDPSGFNDFGAVAS